jgi:O-antigen ligase
MKQSKNSDVDNHSSQVRVIGIGAFFITSYFNSKIQDPFNAPKMWALFLFALWLLGYFVTNLKVISAAEIKKSKFLYISLFIFVSFSLISSLLTDIRYTAFFGENQRRDGFITYLSLAIFFISSISFINFKNIKILLLSANIGGWLLAIYGLMQMSGLDFVSWNNPGDKVISTLGNSNFAGAMMAIFAVLSFGQIFIKENKFFQRVLSGLLTVLLVYVIFPTKAWQGLLILILGVGVIIIVRINNRSKWLGKSSIGLAALASIFSLLGMLQIGPLQDLLYKSSISVRGFYWRAGIEMFKHNPTFGVGFDRYGAYFKEYREIQYPLNYGFNLTSTNAHNVVIQLFATGGIFVGLSYLAITIYVGLSGIRAIRQNQGDYKMIAASVFAAWAAFQAQSLISIDNIGITIWGWVLGGALVALSSKTKRIEVTKKRNSTGILQPLYSSVLLAIGLVLIVPQYRGENYMFQQRMLFNPQDANLKNKFYELSKKTINQPLVEPYYKIVSGNYLLSNGFIDDGLQVLDNYLEYDPRNLDVLFSLARYYENIQNYQLANKNRLQIVKYDPWNAANYLELGRNYKAIGDVVNMLAMRNKIESFASKTLEGSQANSELLE